MKTKNKKINRFFAFATVPVMIAMSFIFTGCPYQLNNRKPSFPVAFNVEGGNGTIKATVDGKDIAQGTPVEQGKTVTFMATPIENYVVDNWTITDGSFEAGTGIAGNTIARVKVYAGITVRVKFKAITVPVTFSADSGNGILTAKVDGQGIWSGKQIEKGKVVEFTATSFTGYAVNGWTLDGISVNGTAETYWLPITKAAEVKVRFAAAAPKIIFEKPANGTLIATNEDGAHFESGSEIETGKKLAFTVTPDTGYEVEYWLVNQRSITGNTSNTYTHTVSESATVNVILKKKLYKVTFDVDGGSPAYFDGDYAYGNTVIKPLEPPRKWGYTLDGWYNRKDNSRWNFDTNVVTEDTTLYAKWTANKYTVTFNENDENGTVTAKVDGNEIHSGSQVAHDTIINFTAMPKTGYRVSYWTVDGAWRKGSTETTLKVTKETEVQVYFIALSAPIPQFKITFENPANGTLTAEKSDGTPFTSGSEIKQGQELIFTVTHSVAYEVDSWVGAVQDTKDYDRARLIVSAETTVSVRLKQRICSVSFKTDGGAPRPDTQNIIYGKKAFEPSPQPTKAGHTFEGWYNRKDDSRWDFTINTVTEDTTLYAKWQKNKYMVTLIPAEHGTLTAMRNGSSFTGGEGEYGEIIEFSVIPDAGYEVDSWIGAVRDTKNYDRAQLIVLAETTVSVTLKQRICSVSFKTDGGAPRPDTQNVIYGMKASEPSPQPTKVGHTFEGWYNRKDDSRWDFTINTVTEDTTLYAKWRINTYTVHFDAQGGSSVSEQYVLHGHKVSAPSPQPTKTGYILEGWYNRKDNTRWDFNTNTVTEDTTLYVKWQINRYLVTFDTRGGYYTPDHQFISHGNQIVEPSSPKKPGHAFKGWYNQNGDTKWNFTTNIVTEDTMLYAKWQRNTYTVSFNTVGGYPYPPNQYILYGDKISEPSVQPTKEGYTFEGWYVYERWNFATDTISGNTTLYAHWQPKTYTVTFSGSAGDGTVEAYVGSKNIMSGDKVVHGETIVFKIRSDRDYIGGIWSVNGSNTTDNIVKSYSHIVLEDVDVQALCIPVNQPYTIDGINFIMKGIAAVTEGKLGREFFDPNPVHTVNLSPYRIGETEVTQELWIKVMGNNPSSFQGTNNPPYSGEVQEKRPVEAVNWFDCIAFCNELSRKAGLEESECVYTVEGHTYTKSDAEANKVPVMDMSKKGFRLPTTDEWEWAAKGGREDSLAGASSYFDLDSYAWYLNSSLHRTHEVKKRRANGYGLYDMIGNVAEWCWYSSEYQEYCGGDYRESAPERLCCEGRTHVKPTKRYDILGLRIVCRP
ncbi:InlB B-repeat-containing protein [Treponema vincentii]|uniref:InlB B-repeat-containing protein n=1 Tax=Treponema vincentii TaxID=69710 RepID=UPI0035F5BAE1